VPDAAPIMGEQHQHEHEAERHGRDHKEIRRDDLADVMAQERARRIRTLPMNRLPRSSTIVTIPITANP
jgi:hypothetical protein